MNKQIITFDANEQSLIKTGGVDKYSSNKVSYIEAHFNLGENWSGYDSVRAVWFTWHECISTVLDTEGICIVPYEVLKRTEKVMVNLVGSISEDDVLTDRLTSYPVLALTVDADAKVCGSNTQPITPSEFEQYVAIVRSLVETVKDIDHISLNSDYTLTIYYSDGTSDTTGSVRGADGNGIESVTKTGTSGLVDTYTITFTDGQTTTFTVTNGARGDTGNGIASIEKTSTVGLVDTYTITFTDGNTTTFTVTNGEKGDKGDTGEVSLADLSTLLPTDTASGSIASFPDGQSVIPALSVVADIEPIQDLHGYDKPWSGGAGVNLIPDETYQGDGFVNDAYINGGTGATSPDAGSYVTEYFPVSGSTTYVISSSTGTITYVNAGICFYDPVKAFISGVKYQGNSVVTFTTPANAVYARCSNVRAGVSFRLQCEKGTSPTAYTPYANICPISGHDEVNVSVCGVNVWDEEWEVGDINYNSGQNQANNDRIRAKGYTPIKPSTQYRCTKIGSSGVWGIFFYDASKAYLGYYGDLNASQGLFTTPAKCAFIRFRTYASYGTTYSNDISINYPSTDTSYHAYNGTTYEVSFGTAGTVYGGTLDVVSGVLTVTKAMYDGGDLTWTKVSGSSYRNFTAPTSEKIVYSNTIPTILSSQYKSECNNTATSSADNYVWANSQSPNNLIAVKDTSKADMTESEFKTAMQGVQFVCELATPQTIQLTPQEVQTLLGQNNIWNDCGDTNVTYKADVTKWVEKQLS